MHPDLGQNSYQFNYEFSILYTNINYKFILLANGEIFTC